MSMIYITGAGGMVGSHMIDRYHELGDTVVGSYYKPTTDINEIRDKAQLIECDVRYFLSVFTIIDKYRPDIIYHLAAQSYPSVSWERPQETMEINATGTINVFEAVKKIQAENPDYNPMIVVACSSAEYGNSLISSEGPVDETTPLLPLHPYGVSKVCQDLLSYQYFVNFGIRCIRARIFNTTGPRKVNDVCSDFTKRIVRMEKGLDKEHTLKVGNIETQRAITDVRDLVSALILLAEKGRAGEVYNISGKTIYQMKEIITLIQKHTDLKFDIKTDPSLLRPTDEKIIWGNSEKLYQDTGWEQKIRLEETLVDMLNYWRKVL